MLLCKAWRFAAMKNIDLKDGQLLFQMFRRSMGETVQAPRSTGLLTIAHYNATYARPSRPSQLIPILRQTRAKKA